MQKYLNTSNKFFLQAKHNFLTVCKSYLEKEQTRTNIQHGNREIVLISKIGILKNNGRKDKK